MAPSYPALLISVPFFVALLLPMVRRFSALWVHPLALLASATTTVLSGLMLQQVLGTGPISYPFGGWPPPWGIEFRVDHLSALMALLINGLCFLVLLFARVGLEQKIEGRSHFFYSLFLLFSVGLTGQCLTGDLFNFYVFLEVSSLTGYALIAVGDESAPFSAFRYLMLGSLGALFYLLGVGYVYGLTGSLNFADVAARLASVGETRTAYVALAFLLAGLGIKAALFPLHGWLPDAYTHAPSVTTAFMAAVGTKVGAYGIFRVLFTVYQVDERAGFARALEFLGWLAATAIVVGSILAIAQADVKRMLAYSSISQIGYVLLGFSLMNANGVIGGVLHIVNHAVMKCCLFLATGALVMQVGHRDLRNYDGLGRQAPWTMAAFTLAAISMIGLPPTAGFFSKWYLILGAVQAEQWVFVAMVLLSTLLNAIYFFRILERAYLRPSEGGRPVPLPFSVWVPLAVTSGGLLALGLGSSELVERVIRFIVPGGV